MSNDAKEENNSLKNEKINLRDLSLGEMKDFVKSLDEKSFRGKQLFDWINKGVTDFREMKNLPEVFLKKLENYCYIGNLEVLNRQNSKEDGTIKVLFGLEDGNTIESVFMKYKYGNTICVSSQAGCRMGCKFCASGIDGLIRNLTPGEILSQVLEMEKEVSEPITRIVIMGTGEPMDNYEFVSKFIRLVHEEKGKNIGLRNITISTCGIIPGINALATDLPQVNLAISLHGPNDEIREKIMPINRKYPVNELLDAVKKYEKVTSRRVTFEYALIKGVNDSQEAIKALGKLLKGTLCHVNLIPLNEVKETGLSSGGRKRALEIQEFLESMGITATVRRQLGADIDGACGQLRLGNKNKQNNLQIRKKH